MLKNYKITFEHNESRIDRWLKRIFSTLNQSFIEKSLRKNLIKVNKKKVSAKYKLKENDIVNIFNYSKESYYNLPNISLKHKISYSLKIQFKKSIIFENNNFIIINKWDGIPTQGGSKVKCSINDIIKDTSNDYNLVHRLDKDTSGLLIVSKNLIYTKLFGQMFKKKQIKKKYLSICEGVPKKHDSLITFNVVDKKKPDVLKEAITKYKVISYKDNISIITFEPLTGKKHQLRIASKYLGCPIIGDTKYNAKKNYDKEILKLNSYLLQFKIEDEIFNFRSELPHHLIDFINKKKLDLLEKNISIS